MKMAIMILLLVIIVITGCSETALTATEERTIPTSDPSAGAQKEHPVVEGETSVAANNILLAALEEHNTPSDCWVVYEDKVYDITAYIAEHPGGEEKITGFCGSTAFEKNFVKEHGEEKTSSFMQEASFVGDFEG